MENDYWKLFQATGAPVFYLLYRYEPERNAQAATAWCEAQAELV